MTFRNAEETPQLRAGRGPKGGAEPPLTRQGRLQSRHCFLGCRHGMEGSDSAGCGHGRETQCKGNAHVNFTGHTTHITELEGRPPCPHHQPGTPSPAEDTVGWTRVTNVALCSIPCGGLLILVSKLQTHTHQQVP